MSAKEIKKKKVQTLKKSNKERQKQSMEQRQNIEKVNWEDEEKDKILEKIESETLYFLRSNGNPLDKIRHPFAKDKQTMARPTEDVKCIMS